jgi:hypothetical protein
VFHFLDYGKKLNCSSLITDAVNKNKILKFNLESVERALISVEKNWRKIDDELDHEKRGRRDIFDPSSGER